MATLTIHPNEIQTEGDSVRLSARIELTGEEPKELWYLVPAQHAKRLTRNADPFLIASILMGMRNSSNIVVRGCVSPSLICNLNEFQAAWHCWCPEKYQLVEIRADEEVEQVFDRPEAKAISAFTGGIDSTYTMYRHKKGLCGRWQRNITAGLFVNGFDIPLDQPDAFERAASRVRETLADLDVELLTVACNHKELNHEWNDTHGIGIVSCLALFAPEFNEGLIGSTSSYSAMDYPWGSNPITDRLLSSSSFSIVHDGAALIRGKKYGLVSQWNLAFNNLRVCFSAEEKDKNCNRCGKCFVTQLAIRRLGLPVPKSFSHDLRDEDILSLRHPTDSDLLSVESALSRSEIEGFGDTSWADALRRIIRFDNMRKQLSQPHNNPLLEKIRRARLDALETRGP